MEDESPSGLRPGPGALTQAGASKQQDLGDMAGSFPPSLWSFPLSPLGTEQRLTDSEGTPFTSAFHLPSQVVSPGWVLLT